METVPLTEGVERAARSSPLPSGAHAAQPLDQHWVMRERGLGVDEGIEHLVVLGRGHRKFLTDCVLFRTCETPPLAFEGEDAGVTLCEGGDRGGGGVHGG